MTTLLRNTVALVIGVCVLTSCSTMRAQVNGWIIAGVEPLGDEAPVFGGVRLATRTLTSAKTYSSWPTTIVALAILADLPISAVGDLLYLPANTWSTIRMNWVGGERSVDPPGR